MNKAISIELSKCFQLANIIATVLVVSIHYQSKHYIEGHESWNYLVQEFLTNGVARIAVPFFALSSGFFFFLKYQGISSYSKNLRKRVSTILVPYIICSFFMFTTQYFYVTALKDLSYPLDVYTFIHKVLIVPVSVQLWFLRDLAFLFLISPALFLLIKHLSTLGIVALGACWFAETQFMPTLGGKYIITIETLFFFYAGGLLATKSEAIDLLFKEAPAFTKKGILLLFLFLIILRIILDPTFMLGYTDYDYDIVSLLIYKLYIMVGVVSLLSMAYGINFKGLSYIASFTFFVFLYHLLPLSYLVTKLGHLLLPDAYIFYFNFPVAIILTFLAAYFLSKLFPRIYSVLSGGRVS